MLSLAKTRTDVSAAGSKHRSPDAVIIELRILSIVLFSIATYRAAAFTDRNTFESIAFATVKAVRLERLLVPSIARVSRDDGRGAAVAGVGWRRRRRQRHCSSSFLHENVEDIVEYFEDDEDDEYSDDGTVTPYGPTSSSTFWGRNNTVEPLMVFPLTQNNMAGGGINHLSSTTDAPEADAPKWITRFGDDSSSAAPVSPPAVDSGAGLLFQDLMTLDELGDLPFALAPASGISYFYLHKTLGLPEDVMWKITLEAGTVLGFSVPNLKYKVALLRRTMNLSDEDVRTILAKQPTILHMSADKNLAPTILFLVRALDLSKADLRAMVVRYPSILCYSMDNLREKIEFFLDAMAFTPDEARRLLVSEPRLMCAAVASGLEPRARFLRREIDVSLEDLRSMVLRNPRLLLFSVERNLKEKLISFFIMRLRMEPIHVRRLLSSYPRILDYSLHDQMIPVAQYFTDELGFNPTELRSILLKFPRLMTHSLRKIKHFVGYLRYELGLDAPQVKRVVFQAPQAIGLNTDTSLKEKIEFLRDAFDLNDEELRKVVAGMPTLIICGVESNLQPKAEYFLTEFGKDRAVLKDVVLTQPTLLGYSLSNRIRPRMERIRSVGARPRSIAVGITMTQAKFDEWLENKREKIELNDGMEPARKRRTTKKEKQARIGDVEAADAVNGEGASGGVPKEDDRRRSRIVHWKR